MLHPQWFVLWWLHALFRLGNAYTVQHQLRLLPTLVSGTGFFHRNTAATCNPWIYSSWMGKECECMFMSHSSCLKSKERIKKSPWDFIDSALPWAVTGEGPHSIAFSVWFILALNIPVMGVPSLSLRPNSNPDFLTSALYCKPCRWVLLNGTGHMNWTHAQMSSFIFPVFIPIHYKHLKQFPSPLVLSFSLLLPLYTVTQQHHMLKHHCSRSPR